MISCSIVINSFNETINLEVINTLIDIKEIEKIFIIYNGNSDISFNLIKKIYDNKKNLFIFRINNNGMGSAHNFIVNNKNLNRYHLLINPDVIINRITIIEGIKKLNKDNNIVSVGPMIHDHNNVYWPSVKLIPDPLTQIIRRINPRSKRNKIYELNGIKFKNDISVPMIAGCYILCRSTILKKIGGFDERFFLYMEDIDIIRRLSVYGKICYMPNTKIIHFNNLESRRSIRMFVIHFISYIKYYNKWGWISDNFAKDINQKFLYYINSVK